MGQDAHFNKLPPWDPLESRSAALLELASAAAGTGLVASDASSRGRRRRLLPVGPRNVASGQLRGLMPFGLSDAFQHLCIPQRLSFGKFLWRERFAGRLAPDLDIVLRPILPAPFRWVRFLWLDAVSPPPSLLLLASSLGPFVVGEVEPGPPAFDPVGGALDAVMALGAGGFGRDVHGGRMGRGKGSLKGVFVSVN